MRERTPPALTSGVFAPIRIKVAVIQHLIKNQPKLTGHKSWNKPLGDRNEIFDA